MTPNTSASVSRIRAANGSNLAHHVRTITEDFLNDGVMFDGSSIAGWKAINELDMMLVPDCSTAVLDPFAAQTSLIIFCDVHEPLTGQPYSRDPRSIAKKAEQYLLSAGIGDKAFFGPEAEFFVFDDVRYSSTMNGAMYALDSEEGPYVSDKKFPDGNTGHRPPINGGYFPVPPADSQSDLRAEMLSVMNDIGLNVEKHHHEVAPSQNELGFLFSALVRTSRQYADLQIRGAARRASIRQDRDLHAEASDGRQRLGHAHSPITNPTTNSYKRLIPGFEAPVLLAYSSRNRSAACRYPMSRAPRASVSRCAIRTLPPTPIPPLPRC
jgi:glutamine synthetase